MNVRNAKIFNFISQNYLAKAFSFYSLSQAISALTSFGILALYTKLLPPADFGKISLIWIFVIIASTLINGKLSTAFFIKFYKVSKEENTRNIYSIFVYNLIVFSLVYFVFLSFPSLFQKILGIQIATSDLNVVFLLILFMIFGDFYTYILMVHKKPKIYFYVKLVFNASLIISSFVYLIVLESGFVSYLKAYLISYLILSLIGLRFFIFNYTPHKKNVIALVNLKNLLKLGLPLVPDALLLMLLTWADRYVLNLYVGLAIVGIYSVGYGFSGIINSFIVTPFGQALSPILFEQFVRSRDEYKKNMSRVFKYYWVVIFSIAIAYFVILKEAYKLFIGAEYMEGYNIIGIVLLGIILWGATNFLGATLIMKEKTGKIFLFTSISVFLNIGLNFILIPIYGMYGAAVATLLSYALQFTLIFAYTQKLVFINYDYRFIFKSVSISLCFLAFVLFVSCLNVNALVSIGLKTVLFLSFILIAYKFLELEESVKRVLNYVGISK
ncbi:MAG: oligosaccharide flippase family protein [bacterium]